MCGIIKHPHPPPSSIGFEFAIPKEIKVIEIAVMRIMASRRYIFFFLRERSISSDVMMLN